MKKQTKKAKMDESLGMRKGKESMKKQSYKARRKESEGMEKHEDKMQDMKLIKKMMAKKK